MKRKSAVEEGHRAILLHGKSKDSQRTEFLQQTVDVGKRLTSKSLRRVNKMQKTDSKARKKKFCGLGRLTTI